MNLKSLVRSIPDYPRPGIVFRDITPLLESPSALRFMADTLVDRMRDMNIDKVAVVESRGFLLGGIIAYMLDAGLVIMRKRGKLPFRTHSVEYALEYGTDALEVHEDSIVSGERVLLHDDLLATGGTIMAAASLVRVSRGTIVGASFIIELGFLKGRGRLMEHGIDEIASLIGYDGEV